jgi:hypothetical protein
MSQSRSHWIQQLVNWDWCPTEQQLAAYADQQMIGAERHVIEKHLAYCDKCLQQVGFLVRESASIPYPVPEDLVRRAIALGNPSPAKGAPSWRLIAVPAAGVAVAVLAWSFLLHTSTPSTRQGGFLQSSPIAKSAELRALTPETAPVTVRGEAGGADARILWPHAGEMVKAREIVFRWRPDPSARFYEAQVASEDGDVLWETECHGTSIKLPDSVPLVKGKTYYFRLRVHIVNGSVERSKPIDFVVG